MTGRTGYAELDKLPGQGCQDKTDRTGEPGEDRKERLAGTGHLKQDRQSKTAMTDFLRVALFPRVTLFL